MQELKALQDQLHEWRQRNFPEADDSQQLLGMVEELGELAHTRLKRIQRIRAATDYDERDAVGDLLIFTLGFCSYRGWDMGELLTETAQHVLRRDWLANPHDGSVG